MNIVSEMVRFSEDYINANTCLTYLFKYKGAFQTLRLVELNDGSLMWVDEQGQHYDPEVQEVLSNIYEYLPKLVALGVEFHNVTEKEIEEYERNKGYNSIH